MAFSLKGIHVPHRKNTADVSAIRMPAPKTVTLLTAMHIGKPAKPVVKAGDQVFVGTLVAEQDGFISSPVYSSVSGTVKSVADALLSNGKTAPAITIESDGEMTPDESIAVPQVNSKEVILNPLTRNSTLLPSRRNSSAEAKKRSLAICLVGIFILISRPSTVCFN